MRLDRSEPGPICCIKTSHRSCHAPRQSSSNTVLCMPVVALIRCFEHGLLRRVPLHSRESILASWQKRIVVDGWPVLPATFGDCRLANKALHSRNVAVHRRSKAFVFLGTNEDGQVSARSMKNRWNGMRYQMHRSTSLSRPVL